MQAARRKIVVKGHWALALLIAPLSLTLPVQAAICPAQLAEQIASVTAQPEFERTRWGILVETLDPDATLYAQAADQFFIPASNAKLLTTAAALTQLGADYRIRTSVYQAGNTLQVVGRGDPSFGDLQLQQLAQQIRDRGVTQIDRLSINDRAFANDAVNPTWEWGDLSFGYAAPVTSMILNGNAVTLRLFPQAIGQPLRVEWSDRIAALVLGGFDHQSRTVADSEPEFTQIDRALDRPHLQIRGQLRVGAEPDETSIAIPKPTQYFLERFRQALTAPGLVIRQTGIATDVLSDAIEIAAIDSPPLSELLIPTNQDSENLYAESLLRQLGVAAEPDTDSPLQAGIAAIETTLARIGVDPAGFDLADGSGLSRHNLVSPAAIVQTLQAMADSPVYRNSLAVAGESGTLINRFQGTIAQGRLYGKTGALSGVAALSGYVDPPNYPPVAFSILVNHFDRPVREVRPAIDAIVLQLAQLQACPDR